MDTFRQEELKTTENGDFLFSETTDGKPLLFFVKTRSHVILQIRITTRNKTRQHFAKVCTYISKHIFRKNRLRSHKSTDELFPSYQKPLTYLTTKGSNCVSD